MQALDETILRRLTLSRYLFTEASSLASKEQTTLQFASINLLQDSIEIFLLSAADHLNAKVGPKTPFEKYFEIIEDKLQGKELPNRKRLFEINKVRVLSKHDGIRPNRDELLENITIARSFFENACVTIFEMNFWSVSLIDLIEGGEVKDVLLAAEGFLKDRSYSECLIECRKALFLAFERKYSIWQFREENEPNFFAHIGCNAPSYCRSKKYVDENVHEPFDFIQLDHSHLDSELVKLGISPTLFWNVWRLTPDTIRLEHDRDWITKHEPQKVTGDDLAERTNYAFEATLDLLLAYQRNKMAAKWIRDNTDWYLRPRPEAPIYKKADLNSKVVTTIPKNIEKLSVKYETPGLSEGSFWYVLHSYSGEEGEFEYISGYLLDSDVIR